MNADPTMFYGQEQRLTARLLKYWELIRRGQAMPEFQHFNHDAVSDLWPRCLLLSVDSRRAISYKYEYVGDALMAIYGRDPTGGNIDPYSKSFPGPLIRQRLAETVAGRQPRQDEGHFISESGRIVKYRACLLPLGNDKKGVTHIVVGLSFRIG